VLKALRLGRATKEWLGVVWFATLIFMVVYLPIRVGKRVDAVTASVGERLAVKDKQIDNLLSLMTKYTEDQQKNMVRVDSMVKSGAEIMHYVRWQILPEVKTSVEALNAVVEGMGRDLPKVTADVDALLKSADVDTKKVGVLIDSLNREVGTIQTLTETLNTEVKNNSDHAAETFIQLNTAIGDLDVLINGDDVKGILASSNEGTKHLAESLKSIDIALMPLRKKLSLLKMILSKAVSVIKLDPTKW